MTTKKSNSGPNQSPAITLIRALTIGVKGVVELRAIPNNRASGGQVKRLWATTPKQVEAFIQENGQRGSPYGVFFGVTKRKKVGGGKKTDCADVGALWADIDTVNQGWDTDACLKALYALPANIRPSILVASGGGVHAYWLLNEGCKDHAAVERANAILGRMVSGDNTGNVDRVMRLPGTWNTKRGGSKSKRVEIVMLNDRNLFTVDELPRNVLKFGKSLDNGRWEKTSVLEAHDGQAAEQRRMSITLDASVDKYTRQVSGDNRTDYLNTFWVERVRYHAPRGYVGINEAVLLTTAKLHCKGWTDDAIVKQCVAYVRDRMKWDAPDENFDADCETKQAQDLLDRWKPRWTELKHETKELKRGKTRGVR